MMKGMTLNQEAKADIDSFHAKDNETAAKRGDSKTSMWEQFISDSSNLCGMFFISMTF